MSIRFSIIEMKSNDKATEFFVGGAPSSADELKGWLKFEDFLREVGKDETIEVGYWDSEIR